MSAVKLGDAAPDFSLVSTDDESYAFDVYRKNHGGWHLLVFFRGGW
ncbi:MAG TPA: hypothetical protein VFK33_05885 [Bacillales bacterium]|nr:hypothetical protein [Bacillales bacterium]